MKEHFTKFLCLFMFLLLFTSSNKVTATECINQKSKNQVINNNLNKSLLSMNTSTKKRRFHYDLIALYGRVELPNEDTAPKGGITIRITSLLKENDYKDNSSYFTCVKIEEGENSTDYEFLSPSEDIILKYEILEYHSAKSNLPYEHCLYTDGFNLPSKNIDKTHTLSFSGSDSFNLNLMLKKAENITDCFDFATINGKIKLPKEHIAPKNGIEIQIFSYPSKKKGNSNDVFYNESFSCKVKIPEGKNETTYKLPSASGPRILTFIIKEPSENKYLSMFHYSENGITPKISESSTVTVSSNNLNEYNVTLKEMTNVNVNVNGKIKIPENDSVQEKDISILLTLYNASSSTSSPISRSVLVIPKGKKEIAYNLSVEPGKYIIKYRITNDEEYSLGYLLEGYLGKTDIVAEKDNANIIIVKDKNTKIEDLILKQRPCLKGIVKLPGENKVAKRELSLYIIARSISDSTKIFAKEIEIPKNKNYVGFNIPVDIDSYSLEYVFKSSKNSKINYMRLRYYYNLYFYNSLSVNPNYINRAYYTEDGFIKHFEVNSEDITNIVFNLYEKKYIEGEIILDKKSSGQEFYLKPILLGKNELTDLTVEKIKNNIPFYEEQHTLYIPKGSKKVKFKFPEQAGKYILMCIPFSNGDYLESFYTECDAVLDPSMSEIISPAKEGVQLLNIKLPEVKHIQGTLSLPKNEFPLDHDIKISVELIKLTDKNELVIYDTKEIFLEKNSSQVDYTLEALSGNYFINYLVENSKKYSSDCHYYKINGYTKDINEAFLIDVNDNDMTNINMTLVKR